jgi:hypothetical protein
MLQKGTRRSSFFIVINSCEQTTKNINRLGWCGMTFNPNTQPPGKIMCAAGSREKPRRPGAGLKSLPGEINGGGWNGVPKNQPRSRLPEGGGFYAAWRAPNGGFNSFMLSAHVPNSLG